MRLIRIALLPALAVTMVLVAQLVPSRSFEPRSPSEVSVAETAYACPAGFNLTVAAGQLRKGSAGKATVLPGRRMQADLADPSSWRTANVAGRGVIVQQQGRGSGPVGFFAGVTPKSDGGGLVVGVCPGLVDDAWWLPLGSGGNHFSTLDLTNLADSPAVVDLELWGPEGRIDAVDAEGIVVNPSTVRRIRLDDVAAGEPQLALRVHRRRGSLSALVNDTSTSVFRGSEQVSATAAPRRSQVLGGLVEGASGRTLAMLNPGTTTARVDVEVIGPKNTFQPSGLQQIKVPAGSLRELALPRAVGSGTQALLLTSDRPVAATVRMAPGAKDYAYAEAVPALAGPAVVPVELGPAGGSPELVLTAPGGAATVELQAYDSKMRSVASTSIRITSGTTRVVDTAKALKAKKTAYIVLRPKGEVVAAATYLKGDGISSLAITAVPLTVLGPSVRPVG